MTGKLRDPDDLFDLPPSLGSAVLSRKLEKALVGNVDEVQRRIVLRRMQGETNCLQTNFYEIFICIQFFIY